MIYQITEEQHKKLIDAIEWAEMLADTSDKSCQEAAWSIEHAKKLLQSLEPASKEPVALRFPTALRKMWSGSEVQNWIDKQGQLFSHSVEQLPVGYFYFDEGNWKQANDPISFPGCTKLYKQATSQTPSSRDLARLAPFVGGLGMSILKELMDAAPQPAQEQNVDAARVLEWMRSKPRKAAQLSFTEGPDRQAAYWIEIAQSEKPPKRTKGETDQNVQLPLTEEQIDAALPSGIYDCLADPWDQGIGDGDEMHSIRADVLRIVRATEAAHDIPENGLENLISKQESGYQLMVEKLGQDNSFTIHAKHTLDVLNSLNTKQR